jgi:hypothetical protein
MNKARKIPCFTALALFGVVAACSDAVPPAAQGAASFHVASPAMLGAACPSNPHWSNAPFIADMSTTQAVTFTALPMGDSLAVDGQKGATVSCSVKARGDGKFDVTASISSPTLQNMQNNSFFVSTTVGPQDTAAPGTVSVSDDQTGNLLTSTSCTIAARPPGSDGNPGVASGKIWASATCSNAAETGNAAPNARCDFTPPAVFVFENCAE